MEICRACFRGLEKLNLMQEPLGKNINNILNKGKTCNNVPKCFKTDNGSTVEGTENIANGFNKYFSNLGQTINNNIGQATQSPETYIIFIPPYANKVKCTMLLVRSKEKG